VEAEHDARLLEQVEQRLPARILERGSATANLQVGLAAAASLGEALELGVGGFG
jgi:hypothetical protein